MKKYNIYKFSIKIICPIIFVSLLISCQSSNTSRYGKYKPSCPAYKYNQSHRTPRSDSFSNFSPSKSH